jgi:predicted Zn-dependent peptidase
MPNISHLANGQKIINVPMPGNQTSTVMVMFATGSKYETAKNNGVAHFLEHMFFKGALKRPTALAISSELDKIGAEFNAFTSKEYTGYYIKSASEHLPIALDVLSDMLLNPILAQEEIDRERGVILEEMNMYQDNPMMHMEDVWEELLYGDSPAGWSTIGTKETVGNMNRADFLDYYQSQYGLSNSHIIIAGSIPDNSQELLEQYFGQAKVNIAQAKLAVVENQTEPGLKLYHKTTDQAHLALGVRTYAYANADEFTMKVLSLILGGSMSSRLFINLRERQGLAYYIRANIESHSDSGYLVTRAGVPVDKLELAAKTIMLEYQKLIDEPVSSEELDKVKGLIHGRLPLGLESSDDNASWYSSQEAILFQQSQPRRGLLSPEELLAGIDQVTPAEVQTLAKKIFVEHNLNFAVIGPYESLDNIQPLLHFK